ncbi:MAG: hypothetical protein WC473_05615 [Patescibacteria group bacterium]
MIVQCCVCRRVRLSGVSGVSWAEQAIPPGEDVSHGYCPECAAKAYEGMERELTNRHQRSPTDGKG